MVAQSREGNRVAAPEDAEASDRQELATPMDDPVLVSREKLSESLTKGLPILAAVLAIVASYKGGLSRVVVNEGAMTSAAVIAILLGLASAVVSWAAVRNATHLRWLWPAFISFAVLLTMFGAFLAVVASAKAAQSYDRPTASASWEGTALQFTGEINLLKADQFMTITVYGYPPGWETAVVPEGASGEVRGSELFRSTSGPDTQGTAKATGAVEIEKSAYEIVEIRVFRSGEDSGCMPGYTEAPPPPGCIQVWTNPRPPATS